MTLNVITYWRKLKQSERLSNNENFEIQNFELEH